MDWVSYTSEAMSWSNIPHVQWTAAGRAGFAPMSGVGREDKQLQRELMSGVIRGSMVKTLTAMQEMLGTLV